MVSAQELGARSFLAVSQHLPISFTLRSSFIRYRVWGKLRRTGKMRAGEMPRSPGEALVTQRDRSAPPGVRLGTTAHYLKNLERLDSSIYA